MTWDQLCNFTEWIQVSNSTRRLTAQACGGVDAFIAMAGVELELVVALRASQVHGLYQGWGEDGDGLRAIW